MNKKNMKDLEIAPQNSKKPNIKKFKNLQNHNEIQMHLKKSKSKIANFVKAKQKLFYFKAVSWEQKSIIKGRNGKQIGSELHWTRNKHSTSFFSLLSAPINAAICRLSTHNYL